jgi:predicted P-loop ATPase
MEFAEFKAIKRVSTETARGFITQAVDRFRPPYGRHIIECPRESVFAAATTERGLLPDMTVNRRYWPVSTGYIDLTALEADRPQLFAEAVLAFDDGYPWHLETPELEGLAAGARAERQARLSPPSENKRKRRYRPKQR